MQREIKFREYRGDGRWHYWGLMDEGKFVGPCSPNSKAQQYTGIKDVNGKEIYEGDILKKRETSRKTYVGEVFFASVRCAFAVRHDMHTGHPRYDDLVKCKWSESDGYCIVDPDGDRDDAKEVIGNIYENPELITRAAGV